MTLRHRPPFVELPDSPGSWRLVVDLVEGLVAAQLAAPPVVLHTALGDLNVRLSGSGGPGHRGPGVEISGMVSLGDRREVPFRILLDGERQVQPVVDAACALDGRVRELSTLCAVAGEAGWGWRALNARAKWSGVSAEMRDLLLRCGAQSLDARAQGVAQELIGCAFPGNVGRLRDVSITVAALPVDAHEVALAILKADPDVALPDLRAASLAVVAAQVAGVCR